MHRFSFWFFQRGITPEREITRIRKKKRVSYFSMRNPYMKFEDPNMHGFWRTDARTHVLTNGRTIRNNMLPQLLWSWGHNNCYHHSSLLQPSTILLGKSISATPSMLKRSKLRCVLCLTHFALAWHIFKEPWLQDIQLHWVPSSITFFKLLLC